MSKSVEHWDSPATGAVLCNGQKKRRLRQLITTSEQRGVQHQQTSPLGSHDVSRGQSVAVTATSPQSFGCAFGCALLHHLGMSVRGTRRGRGRGRGRGKTMIVRLLHSIHDLSIGSDT